MSNLTVSGDSDYSSTGTPDTFTAVSDGPSGTDAVAAHINGVATAITELQTLLGNGLTLKGSVADLVTRLSRIVGADGALVKGTSFPGTPIDGQPFYRTDLNTLYIYDAGSTSWTIGIDSGIFALVDGTRDFTGDVKVKKSTPGVRLRGTETSAADVLLREDTGILYVYYNTGSEGSPTWVEVARFDVATGALVTVGNLKLKSGTNYLGTFDHANTADRTYSLPDFNWDFITGTVFKGPSSIASGSTRSLETFTSATGNLSGIHYYSGNFTLDSGHTLTIPAGSGRLAIIATGTITINGTITGAGGGLLAGGATSSAGNAGTDQPGGASGDGNVGGAAVWNGLTIQAGGSGVGTQLTGSSVPGIAACLMAMGGASGAGSNSVTGGRGGASIILIAPTVVLAATATLNTAGEAGSNAAPFGNAAGGGAAGNIYIITRDYTDGGATFTQTGGAGGAVDSGLNGYAGAAGIKQINIHA